MWVQTFFGHFSLDKVIRTFKTGGTDLAKLAELIVGYKIGDNYLILRCHEFAMQRPIRIMMGLLTFSTQRLYRTVEILGENREAIITTFRRQFLREYGPNRTDTVFDWTLLVHNNKPGLAMRGHYKDGHPEECQMNVGISRLAKPQAVPIGITVMSENTHNVKHMRETYGQVASDLTADSTMIISSGANNKPILDMITEAGSTSSRESV